MIAYWILFLVPVFPLLFSRRLAWSVPFTLLLVVLLSLFIGLRYQVGGDWYSYYLQLIDASQTDFSSIAFTDIGYQTLNLIFSSVPHGLIWVNLTCGVIFSSGLLFLCRSQPIPWLAFLFSIPYFVIVVSLGYTRQSAAAGFLMIVILFLQERRVFIFLLLLLAGSLFHFTVLIMAVLCLPMIRGRSTLLKLLQFLILFVAIFSIGETFFVARLEKLIHGYIVNNYSSQGAYIRCALNLLPSLLALTLSKRLHFTRSEQTIWVSVSILSLASTLVLFLFPDNSTAVDRISLYFIPVQLAINSRIPYLFVPIHTGVLLSLIVFNSLILFVWLNYATNAFAWLPYRNILF